MVKYHRMFRGFYFLIVPFFMQSMDQPPSPKKTNSLIWLDDNKIIFTSRTACYVKNPFSGVAKFKLHDELTHHIIINKDKTKVGLLCDNSFLVYDLQTRKKIYSLSIAYSDNYSATFSPMDDIIMFHKSSVSINSKQTLNLPFIQFDQLFSITCNHETEEIMYPSNNNTFSRKSLKDNQITRHPRSFNHENINYKIDSALYTSHKNYIILHAHKSSDTEKPPAQDFFLLHDITKTIMRLPLPKNKEGCTCYYDVKILPNSLIAGALCNKQGLHFFDITQKEQILLDLIYRNRGYACKNNKNTFDCNPQTLYYAVITNKKSYLNKIPDDLLSYIMKSKICSLYIVLCNYFHEIGFFIPKDIKSLLVQYFHRVYRRFPKEDSR